MGSSDGSSLATGVGEVLSSTTVPFPEFSSESSLLCEAKINATASTPTRMKKNGPEPPFFFSAGFAEDVVEAGALGDFGVVGATGALGALGADAVVRVGVDDKDVEAVVAAKPFRVGTSGTVTVIVEPFAALDALFLTDFLATFFALFLTGRFAAVAFFTGRLAAAFFGAAFFATFFTGRLAADFFAVFLAVRFAAT